MDNQDSEPLFGEDVYSLLRDDSLLHRTGSNNFAALIDSTDAALSENLNAQQQQQQLEGYQEQQLKPEYQQQQQQLKQDQQLKPEYQQQQQLKQDQQQQQLKQDQQQQQQLKQDQQQQQQLKQDQQQKQEVQHQQHQEPQQCYEVQELKQEYNPQNQRDQPSHQQAQCYIYEVPLPHLGATREVMLVRGSNNIAELNCPPIANEQQQQPHQLQEQQPIVSWDEIDMEQNEDLVQSSDVNVISSSSFMTIMEETSSVLPDTTSRTVPSLQPWAGKYNFNISLPTGNKDRNKWCYNQELKKLYVCPNVAVPVNIALSRWIDATITITPVFQQSHHRMEPVSRCYNCKNIKNCDSHLSDYVVHIEGEGCEYEVVQDRHVVKVPVQSPPPGEVVSTLLVKLMCLTSCVGGPNRRPFCLVLTLRSNITGSEIGRQILDVKCCKCPSRDMTNDGKCSTPNTNNSAQTTEDGKLTKIRKISSQIQVGLKRKKPKIKHEPGSESRYVNIAVPVEFELQVKSYVNGLIAEQILRRNQPNLLLYPEEED